MTEDKYIEKLLKLPDQFKQAAYQKRWPRAKYIYDTACRVAEFMDVPTDIKQQLFGYEQEEMYIDGLFPKELVSKAYEICTIKLYQGYEHESYRRYGQAPQYYPQPRYPVPGYDK